MRFIGTGAALPERRVDSTELFAELFGPKKAPIVQERLGVLSRFWLGPDETAATLATAAVRAALVDSERDASELSQIIFVSSTGGDMRMPATASAVIAALEAPGCFGFDINNACAGFVTGLWTASCSLAQGAGPIAVVAAETPSRWFDARHPRPMAILADAAAAVIVERGPEGAGVLAHDLGTDPTHRESVVLDNPGVGQASGAITFGAHANELGDTVCKFGSLSAARVLEQARLARGDLEWFVLHQPNQEIFERLVAELELDAERTFGVCADHGSLGSASAALAFHRLRQRGSIVPGSVGLISAVGGGVSWASLIVRA